MADTTTSASQCFFSRLKPRTVLAVVAVGATGAVVASAGHVDSLFLNADGATDLLRQLGTARAADVDKPVRIHSIWGWADVGSYVGRPSA